MTLEAPTSLVRPIQGITIRFISTEGKDAVLTISSTVAAVEPGERVLQGLLKCMREEGCEIVLVSRMHHVALDL